MTIRTRRPVRLFLALGAVLLGLVSVSTPAAAQVETFIRFEENAQANWRVTQACPDGGTSTLFVSLVAGREFESPDLEDVNRFATLRIRGFDCEGNLVNEFGTGPATYTSSPSLQDAQVTGTILLRSGATAIVDVTWEGTGGIETRVNQTQFDGFVGIFTSKTRDATATGTIVVDGETIVSGPADSADIETLEDRNRTLP